MIVSFWPKLWCMIRLSGLLPLMLLFLVATLGTQNAVAADLSPTLEEVMAMTPGDEPIPVVLFLAHRLEMDELYPDARLMPMNERREYVVERLKTRFAEMSPRVMERLNNARKSGQVSLLRPLWIINGVRVSATAEVLEDLSRNFPEVEYIASDPVYPNTLDSASWGVSDLRAPGIWSAYGDGRGVIVGHVDSGCEYYLSGFAGHLWINDGEDLNHNGVIEPSDSNAVDDDGNGYVDDFRGWNFDDDNNDVSDHAPSSSAFHGTRTASIVSSNFQPCDTVCVAPGADLMFLAAIWTQGATWEASQYAITMGAHLITQSVSFKLSDCNDTAIRDCPNYVAARFVSEMELAAGLIHSNSTGNTTSNPVPLSLPSPASSPPPAMTPQHWVQGGVSSIIAVGAYTRNGDASAFGRGPSGWSRNDICTNSRMPFCGPPGRGNSYPARFSDYPYRGGAGRGLLKPDFTAPYDGRCLYAGESCSQIGGTSAATPHVGGVLALMISAFPGITPEAVYLLLTQTAQDAGPTGVDTVWGFGKIRPFPACSTAARQRGVIQGTVTSSGGQPLEGVRISVSGDNVVFTNAQGNYALSLIPGNHALRFFKHGWWGVTRNVQVSAGGTITENVSLSAAPASVVTFTASGEGAARAGVPVWLPEIPWEGVTDESGSVMLNSFAGTYEVIFGDLPWREDTATFVIPPENAAVNLPLERSERAMRATGPDSLGHYIYDNFDAPAAQYNWVEINPNEPGGLEGQNLNLSGDDCIVRVLPFTFRFYGQNYTQVTVCANGLINLGNNVVSEWGPYPIPATPQPNGFLAPFFDDWEPQQGGRVLWYHQPDSHRVIIEWFSVPHGLVPGRATFQAILYDPSYWVSPDGEGIVKYQYKRLDGRFEGSVGIENQSGTDGLQYRFQLFHDRYACRLDSGRALLVTTDSTLKVRHLPAQLAPAEFALEPNFPNPFNPVTTFTWSVPRESFVRLVLFDVLGREAAVVFEGRCVPGTHSIGFDASPLTSGVYFARLENAGQTVSARKIVLMK